MHQYYDGMIWINTVISWQLFNSKHVEDIRKLKIKLLIYTISTLLGCIVCCVLCIVITLRRMRRAGHVASMSEERGVYRVLVGKLEGRRPLGRPRRRWVDNIRMDLQEV